MKTFAKTIVGMSLLIGMAGTASASTLKEIADSTYMLYDRERPHCSIVAVSPTQFVTANHCVEGMSNLNIRVTTENDKFEPVSEDTRYLEIMRTIKAKDVALLKFRGSGESNKTWVDVSLPSVEFTFGEKLIAVGYPGVMDLTVTEGLFTGFVKTPFTGMDGAIIKTTVPVTGGSSGGGYYHLKKGETSNYELIGTTIGMDTRTSFQTYITTPKSLDEVFKSLLDTKKAASGGGKDVKKGDSTGELINPFDLK